MQFTKLFSSILDSTIWQEPKETKIVWITLLAMVDRNGEVYASIPGLASRAGVTLAECEAAIECLSGPDKYSRTKDNDGRRIEEIDGGWILLNHGKYRELLSSEERKEYNRRKQAERRARLKKKPSKVSMTVNDGSMKVNRNQQCQHITDTEADTEAEANGTARANTVETDTREGGLAERVRASVPDFEQVLATAHNGGIPREVAEAFFDSCEAAGWLHKQTGKPLGNWAAALRQYNRNWKSNEQRNGHRKDSSRNAGTSNEGRAGEYAGI